MQVERLLLCFTVVAVGSVLGERDTYELECKDLSSQSAMVRLHDYVFCKYDPYAKPATRQKNATVVRLMVKPTFAEFVTDDIIDIHTWTALSWQDPHIPWSPANFDGIQEIHVRSSRIWVPDITVHSTSNAESANSLPFTDCWAQSNGAVRCVPAAMYSTHCTADHTWWPYDEQNCTIAFGSWAHAADDVDLTLMGSGLMMDDYIPNKEWKLMRSYVTKRTEPFKFDENTVSRFVSVHFIFRRHSHAFHVFYVMPAIALMILTLTTLWLEPRSTERMIVANLNFVCHLICIQEFHYVLPPNGESPPKLLLLYDGSLALASFALVLTSLLRRLMEATSEVPVCVSTSASVILKSKLGQILLLSVLDPKASADLETEADDNTGLVRGERKEPGWAYVAILAGWLALFGVLLAYVVLASMYLPREVASS